MPRIPTSVILKAHRQNPLLPLLLKECRSLDLARNELRWLRARALESSSLTLKGKDAGPRHKSGWRNRLRSMCRTRSGGMPLQYILGDQPFGDLDILCRRGVLIPRPETESYTFHTAELILKHILRRGCCRDSDSPLGSRPLRIIDLCSGTGCISLLLHALLATHYPRMAIVGIDISPAAIELANRNLHHNLRLGLLSNRALAEVQFRRGNVLGNQANNAPRVEEVLRDYMPFSDGNLGCDVLISNPPYISPTSFRDGTTARSVRIFEPTLALVPPGPRICNQGDLFYHSLIAMSFKLRTKLTILECGDRMQANRVVAICRDFIEKERKHYELLVEVFPNAGVDNEACAVIIREAREIYI